MSWFNNIPGIGHIKGLVHDIAGDHEEAREAYRAANSCTSGVLNSIPVVGHVKGLVHDVCGDKEGAQKAYQTANNSLNTIPVVGHVKGVVHLVQGDEEKAKEAYMAATRSTLVLGGGAVGSLAGPGGAAALAAYTGALTDTVVSYATKKPVGLIRNIETIVEAKDVTDVLVGMVKISLEMGLDAAAGASIGGAIDSAAQLPTEQIMKSTPNQVVKSAPNQILKSAPNQVVKSARNQILKSAPMAPNEFVKSATKIDIFSLMKGDMGQVIKQSSKQITKEVGKKVVTNQVLKSTQKQIIAKEVEIIGGAIYKQAAKNQVVQAVADNTLTKPKQRKSLTKKNGVARFKLDPNIEYYEPSDSTASEDEDEEYIYFFQCLDRTPTPYIDGAFKVGMSRKDIKTRLMAHKYTHIINSDSYITVFECNDAVEAETQILRDNLIYKARIPNENGNLTEFLDTSIVSETYVLAVIQREVANGKMPKRFKLRRIDLYY